MNLMSLRRTSILALGGAMLAVALSGVATAQTAQAGGPPSAVSDDTVWLPTDDSGGTDVAVTTAAPAERAPSAPGEQPSGVTCTQGNGQPDQTIDCQRLDADGMPRIDALPAQPLPPR